MSATTAESGDIRAGSATVAPGRASGHIVGGNLDTFSRLLGTPYFPNIQGAILFIEDVHKDAYESSQTYEFQFSDKKTRKFVVVGQSE